MKKKQGIVTSCSGSLNINNRNKQGNVSARVDDEDDSTVTRLTDEGTAVNTFIVTHQPVINAISQSDRRVGER